jgi:crotonobetainyl-CoA:carnitine CoA-transferase CaiB-like acyl-CoA transferase
VGDELPDYAPAALLGQDSEEVLRGLGYAEEELRAMHESGVYQTWDDLKAKHHG